MRKRLNDRKKREETRLRAYGATVLAIWLFVLYMLWLYAASGLTKGQFAALLAFSGAAGLYCTLKADKPERKKGRG